MSAMDGTPAIYDLGEFALPSGTSVSLSARVLIDVTVVPEPPLDERGFYIETIVPQAMARLRERLGRLRYRVGERQSIDPTEAP